MEIPSRLSRKYSAEDSFLDHVRITREGNVVIMLTGRDPHPHDALGQAGRRPT